MMRDEIYALWLRKAVLDRKPTPASEILVAFAIISVGFVARLTIERTGGHLSPFLMTYPATMITVFLAGYRPALIVAGAGMIGNIRYVLPFWIGEGPILGPNTIVDIVVTSLSLAIIIWITSAFRQASIRLRDLSDREIETLGLLIEEMDHRTKNNFQIAAILLDRATQSGSSGPAANDVQIARNRLLAISKSYENLATSSKNARVAPLREHIQRIVHSFEVGLLPDNVVVSVYADPIMLDQQRNLVIGLIVGEWITNAIKYAFAGRPGKIIITASRIGSDLVVLVVDDGRGIEPGKEICAGTGSTLVRNLARTIGATVETEFADGARCALSLPVPD